MDLEKKSKLDDFTQPPQIILQIRPSATGKGFDIRHADFVPGMTIERCGRKYIVNEKGQQIRIKP
jgi:hypothetical protein